MLDNTLSLYAAIAEELSKKILEGFYLQGQKLPTEPKLMQHYNVSRTTIRQAILQLERTGFVKRIQGSGTYITYRKKNAQVQRSTAILPFSAEMEVKGKKHLTKVISFEVIPANKVISESLGIVEGERIYSFERLRMGDKIPICLEHSYMPVTPYPDLTIAHLEQSKYHYIEQEKGKQIAYSHQNVSAILSNEKTERLLNLKKRSPILKIIHTTYLDDGSILDLTTIMFSSDIYEAHFIKFRDTF